MRACIVGVVGTAVVAIGTLAPLATSAVKAAPGPATPPTAPAVVGTVVTTIVTTTTKPPPVRVVLSTTSYVLPAKRPIVDGWRAPDHRYGAGNRGLEIGTAFGDVLVAPNDGVVTFAGYVAGTLYLVIAHSDGIRTTLGGMASVRVGVGTRVRRSRVVGTAGGTTHFGARYGRHYFDPSLLLGASVPERSWLVPNESAGGASSRRPTTSTRSRKSL